VADSDQLNQSGEYEEPHGPGAGGQAVAHRESAPARLVGFLRGSWRELQRVQWPDRRQVMQATGVVLGFVIVAGVFLGVSDLVASKLMNLVLK
jgi:preprotein translocase subunit SecE